MRGREKGERTGVVGEVVGGRSRETCPRGRRRESGAPGRKAGYRGLGGMALVLGRRHEVGKVCEAGNMVWELSFVVFYLGEGKKGGEVSQRW